MEYRLNLQYCGEYVQYVDWETVIKQGQYNTTLITNTPTKLTMTIKGSRYITIHQIDLTPTEPVVGVFNITETAMNIYITVKNISNINSYITMKTISEPIHSKVVHILSPTYIKYLNS